MEINNLQVLSEEDLQRLAARIAGQLEIAKKANAGQSRVRPASARRRKPAAIPQFLTAEETSAFFAAVSSGRNPRDLALFEVAYHRGLRASEVGLLRLEHLRLTHRRLYITRVKGGRSGEFPLTDREIRALRAWLKVRGAAPGPLFPSRNSRPISRRRLDELIKRYGAAAQLPEFKRHFHCLRHSCATDLVERDIDIVLIQDHLGHADIRNTQIYARVSDRKRRQTGELLKDW
ncbi:MAG: tyrosine-type recombinase/integrase [Bryobacteraceae bacterium]|nr:tyrosine-type recombinase/integrase [Bryobacteraceae bacterium]